MQKFVFDKTMVNNHLLALNKNLEQHRKVKKTLLSYLEKLSNSLYDDFNSKDTDFLLTLLAEAHMLFENIKLNINKLVELKMFLENVSKSEYLNTIDFERYHNEYSELFEKISDANASYLSFMNNYKMTLGVKDSEEIFEPSIFDIPSEENNNISSNDNIDVQEENIETSEVSNNIEDAVDTEIPEEPNISKTTDAIVFIDDTDDGIVNPDEFTFVEVPDTTSVEKTADDIVSTILEDSIEQADDILLIDTTDDGVVNPDTVVLIENVDESPKQEEKNSSNDLNKKENLIIDSIVKKIMQITDSIPTITDFYTTTTIENSDLPEEEKIDLNISKKPDIENTTTNVYDNLKEESEEITNVEENISLEDNLTLEEEPSIIETSVEKEVIEENNEEIAPVSDETEDVAEEVVEENNEEVTPVSDEIKEVVEEEIVEENNEEITPVSEEIKEVVEEVVEENNEEITPVSEEIKEVVEEIVEENNEEIAPVSDETEDVAEEVVEEEINEETEFSQEQLEEKTLVICKDDDIAILPYSFTDLEEFFSDNPEKYSSIQDIIEQEYTVSLKDYENTSFARYKEAYKLAKDKSNLSLPQSVTYAKKLLLENDVLPIVIASCKNIDELDNYLDCLDSNKLEDFKYFKIIEK